MWVNYQNYIFFRSNSTSSNSYHVIATLVRRNNNHKNNQSRLYTFAPCDQTFDPGVSRSGNFLEAEERYRKEERRGERKKEEGKNEERWWQSTAKKIQGESFVDDLIWSRQNVGNWNAAGGGGRKKRGKIWLALEEFRWPVSWPIPRESFLGELGEEGVG